MQRLEPLRCKFFGNLEKTPFAGASLNDLVIVYGEKLLGQSRRERNFPLDLEVICAKNPAQPRVWPSGESAERFGGEPKNMAWYFLNGGAAYAGFKRPVSEKEFKEALRENRILELLQRIEVQAGDTLYIPGGRIHALEEGCKILEIRQNSARICPELSLKESIPHLKFDDTGAPIIKPICIEENDTLRRYSLLSTLFFSIEKIELAKQLYFESDPKTFQIFFDLNTEDTILLPADSESIALDLGVFIKIN